MITCNFAKTMRLSRLVWLVSKPVLSSLPPPGATILGAQCRAISTGRDQVKFGNVGGKEMVDETRELDVLLGKWVTHPEKWKRYERYMSDDDKEWHRSGKQRFVSFERNNGEFKMVSSMDDGSVLQIHFQLGVKFLKVFPDDTFMKMLVVQHLNDLITSHCKNDNFDGNYVNHIKARGDKLYMTQTYPDGAVALRVYFREAPWKVNVLPSTSHTS